MAKFKVLKNNIAYFKQVGISLDGSAISDNSVLTFIVSTYIHIAMYIGIIVCGAYVYQNPTEVKPALGAFKICVSGSQCSGMYIGIIKKVIKMQALQRELQQMVDRVSDANGENSEEYRVYWEGEQKGRKLTQILSYFVIMHASIFSTFLIFALYSMASGNYDTSSWYLAFYTAIPFDQTRVWAWFITWLIQLFMAYSYVLCMTTNTSFFVSCCYYIYAMCDHYNVMITTAGKTLERMRTEVQPSKIRQFRREINTRLCDLIKIQIQMYEIFHMLEDIISVAIFSLLPPNSIFMSICMYEVEVSFTNFEPPSLLFDVSCLLRALFWPVFLCNFATNTTDRVSSIDNMAYNSNWFEYPTNLQKYFILTIARSQQSVYFTGLGLVSCSLEVFGKLCRTSTSYYLMFRVLDRR